MEGYDSPECLPYPWRRWPNVNIFLLTAIVLSRSDGLRPFSSEKPHTQANRESCADVSLATWLTTAI